MALKNVLIVKLSAIGDVVHALPVAYALKQTYPDVRITWVVEPPALDLVKNNPCIDEVVLFEKREFKSLRGFLSRYPAFAKRLRQIEYDAVLDLQGLFKSAAIAFTARGRRKLGVCDMRELSGRVSKPVVGAHAGAHVVERYLDVARALGCRCDEILFPIGISEEDKKKAQGILERAGAKTGSPYVVLAVGANWPNKRWPARYFVSLSDWIYRQNIIPVLSGSGPVDENLALDIASQAEIPPVSIVGQTKLRQLAQVMRGAKAVVGGDTGAVHLAAAVGARAVMLLGPTDARRNGPYGQAQNAIEVSYDCRHCWKRQCRFGRECLADIAPEAVIKKLETLL